MIDKPVSELRTDPVTGRKVYIAEDRAGRPSDYTHQEAEISKLATSRTSECPFCAGHEQQTPPTLAEVDDANGKWQVRVIPNKYPAVSETPLPPRDTKQNDEAIYQPAYGAHEVIIESPDHVQDLTDLPTEKLATVLAVYRDRAKHHLQQKHIEQVAVFKNVGYAGGASLEHLHSQLVALPYVSPVLETELEGSQTYHLNQGSCLFCDLIKRELTSGERLVIREEHFVAFCAVAGRQPFETWILPTAHESDFSTVAEDQLFHLASILQRVLIRLQHHLHPLSYNLLLHTSPAGREHKASFHWHWELIPRSSQLAGLEWGSGVHINSLSPERAASMLRGAN